MKFTNFIKSVVEVLTNAYYEIASIFEFIFILLSRTFKFIKLVFSNTQDTVKKNAKTVKKFSYGSLVFFFVWCIFDLVVRVFGLFDIDAVYESIFDGILSVSAFIHTLYWVPYRHARWYFLKLLKILFIKLYFIYHAFMMNFFLFRDSVSVNPTHEETAYLFIVYLLLNYSLFRFIVWLGLKKDKNRGQSSSMTKDVVVKKFYLVVKFITLSSTKITSTTTSLYIILRKIFIFLDKHVFFYFKAAFRYLFNIFYRGLLLIWRPIFKKWSYYGIYRAYRSKWLKK